MAVLERRDVTLVYDDSGPADGPAIVLLHGLSMSRQTWARFVPDLEKRFRVLRLDQRGHGESSHAKGTYVLDTYLADTVAFIEEVVRGPSFLVGHSLGGVIAHGVAQTRPDLVTGVLLEDPPLYVVDRMREAEQQRGDASSVAAMFPLMQQLCRDMQGRSAPVEEWVSVVGAVPALNRAGSMVDVIGADAARAMAEAFSRLDPEIFTPAIDGSAISGNLDLSKRLLCPAVVLRADPALGPAFSEADEARFLDVNPTARVVVFDGASHAIHDEQPERFLRELLDATSAEQVSSS
jgi:pimeloyl-ACP methyl ester carboxylesterase